MIPGNTAAVSITTLRWRTGPMICQSRTNTARVQAWLSTTATAVSLAPVSVNVLINHG